MDFKVLDQNSLTKLKSLIKINNYSSSFYTLGVIFVWKDYFSLQYALIDDCFLFKGVDLDNSELYFYPLGNNPLVGLTHIPKGSKTIYIPEEAKLSNQFNDVNEMIDDFDYVYEFQNLLSLTGKDKTTIRNHINKFKKTYPSFSFQKITQNNITDIHTLLHSLDLTNEYKRLEIDYNLRALDLFFQLDFVGYILYVEDRAVAFSIGEIINDTLYVQFEKNLHSYHGSGDMNRYLFLHELQDLNLKYVNREEDAGDLGLRTSKMRLKPIKFIRKYYGNKQ